MTDDTQFSDITIREVPLEVALLMLRQVQYGVAPVVWTNVPHQVFYYNSLGFEFGYDGKGPRDLALNVCEWYLARIGYQGRRMSEVQGPRCVMGDAFRLSFALHIDFTQAFIEEAPRAGAVVPFENIRDWFRDHLTPDLLEKF